MTKAEGNKFTAVWAVGAIWVSLVSSVTVSAYLSGIHAASPKHEGAVSNETYHEGMNGLNHKMDMMIKKIDRLENSVDLMMFGKPRANGVNGNVDDLEM